MAPIGKHRPARRIDRQPARALGVAGGDGSGFTAPPSIPTVTAPGAPTLTTALTFSAVTPSARVDAAWADASAYDGEIYGVAISTDSSFVTGTEIYTTAPNQTTVSIDNRAVGTLYYVRVRTVIGLSGSDWGPSASITTPLDTVPPAAIATATATFTGTGDFVITWTNPTSANFRDVEIKIYNDSGKSILYATIYDATQRYVWTAAANLAATANVGDPSPWADLRSRSWGGVFQAGFFSVGATKAAPAAPTIAVDFTGADAVYTITPPSDAAYLSFVADTSITARRLGINGRYTYTFDTNRVDHVGTADPVLSYSFTAVDGLNQVGTATTGTATNAAPSAPTVTLIGGQNQLVCQVTSALAADFLVYEYVWKKDGATQLTQESASAEQQYAAQTGDEGLHSWTCTVRQKDMFGQYSSATASSAVVLDALTIAYLRAGLIFSDSVGTSQAILLLLKDALTGSGPSYSA